MRSTIPETKEPHGGCSRSTKALAAFLCLACIGVLALVHVAFKGQSQPLPIFNTNDDEKGEIESIDGMTVEEQGKSPNIFGAKYDENGDIAPIDETYDETDEEDLDEGNILSIDYPESCLQFETFADANYFTRGNYIFVDGAYAGLQATSACECINGEKRVKHGLYHDWDEVAEDIAFSDEVYQFQLIEGKDIICVKEKPRQGGMRKLPNFPNGCSEPRYQQRYYIEPKFHRSVWIQIHVRNTAGVKIDDVDELQRRFKCGTQGKDFARQQFKVKNNKRSRRFRFHIEHCGEAGDAFAHMAYVPFFPFTHKYMKFHSAGNNNNDCTQRESIGDDFFRTSYDRHDGRQNCNVFVQPLRTEYKPYDANYPRDFCPQCDGC